MTTTTASVTSLTVRELPSASTVANYSLVEAFSDAGIPMYYDGDPQSRGRPTHEDNVVYLWELGCQLHDVWDCPTICKDVNNGSKALWNSTDGIFTLQNCLIYPLLEYSAAKKWLWEERPGLLEKYGIRVDTSKAVKDVMPKFGDWPAIGHCRLAMCRQLMPEWKHCDTNRGNKSRDTVHFVGSKDDRWTPQLYVDVDFCSLGWGTPNADIGGAGVNASYIQQLAIAILGWAFLRVPELSFAIRKRLFPCKKAKLEEKLSAFRARSSTAATVSALVGFQETQIFFSITLQVVCLITFFKFNLLMASSVVDLVANRFMFKVIGASGMFPVVLNLCTIRRNQATVDWFLLIASSCCVSLAIATWSIANTLSFDPEQLSDSGSGPHDCGNSNPLTHCFGDIARDYVFDNWLFDRSLTIYNSFFLSEPALIVPLLVLVGLAATKFKSFRTRPFVRGDVFEWIIAKLPRNDQRRHVKGVFHVLVVILECWLVITSVALLIASSMMSIPISQQGSPWTVGQIIAVAVWAPVLVNWLHLLYRGPQAGLDFQMANGYAVVKQPMETLGSMALLHAHAGSSSKPQTDPHESQALDPLLGRGSARSSVSVPASLQPEQNTRSQSDPSQSARTSTLLNKSNTAPPA